MPTPRQLGYRWPAEWEEQRSVWFAWPHDPEIWPVDLEPVEDTLSRLIGLILPHQAVGLLVPDAETGVLARQRVGFVASDFIDRLTVEVIRTDDSWLRDSGPTWVESTRDGSPALVGWGFNGWGKFEPFANDAAVPGELAARLGLPMFVPGIVLEGGAIDGDGAGTCLTTEQCLLSPNRNPGLTKEDYERHLSDYLCVDRVVWLDEGLANDHTDGHVDVVARFVGPAHVVALRDDDPASPNHRPLADNLRRLELARTARGEAIRVATLPMPEPVVVDGEQLAAGYANFIIANGVVVAPTWNCPQDDAALAVLRDVFPGREVVGLDSRTLLRGGGSFHCLSQQEPLVRTR